MVELKIAKQRVVEEVERMREELIQIADRIHAHPEIAFEEIESSALLSETLESGSFALERGVAGLDLATYHFVL